MLPGDGAALPRQDRHGLKGCFPTVLRKSLVNS